MQRFDPSTRYDWHVIHPQQFVDRRMQYRRDVGIVRYGIRAYRGAIVKRDEETGKPQYASCGHAHRKPSAARRCAEVEARKRNRELRKQRQTEEAR